VELLKWFKDTATEVEAREKQRLAAERGEDLKHAEDAAEEDMIRKYYGALLGRVSPDTKRKLKLLGQIHRAQPDVALEDVGGVPPLPNKERLKDWYEVDLIDSYFDVNQKQKLQRFYEVVGQEMWRIESHINPEDHLRKHMEYEVSVATDEKVRQKARHDYQMRLSGLTLWRYPGLNPASPEVRWKDAVTLKFLRSKGGSNPRTRRELYSQIEDLGLDDEYQQYLANEQFKTSDLLISNYRKRHPHGAVNAYFNFAEEAFELMYDGAAATEKYFDAVVSDLEAKKANIEEEIRRIDDLTTAEILDKHPEWEDEIRFLVQNHRWDLDIPASRYEHDWAEHERIKKIWWEPFNTPHHH